MGNIRSKCSKVKESAAQATRSEGGQPDCCSSTQEASESQSADISTLSVVEGGCNWHLAWNSEGNVIMGPAATLHSNHAVVLKFNSKSSPPNKFILKRQDNKFGIIFVKDEQIFISDLSDREPSEFVLVDSERSVGSVLVKHSGTDQWVKVQDRENKLELAIALVDKEDKQLATPFEVSSV